MRRKLQRRDQERFRVTAQVDRSGSCIGWKGRRDYTILLKNIRDEKTEELLTDHMWFKKGAWSMYLRFGDRIAFDARVSPYVKGDKRNKFRDWHMQRPTKVVII